MRFQRSLLLLTALALVPIRAAETSKAPAFQFRQINYFHRWSKNDQHEYTPDRQEDLDRWTDMITINDYPGVHDGDALAVTANTVLGNYKSHEGRVLKTNSVPRTTDRPAEHFIAVMFTRPAFARSRLLDSSCGITKGSRPCIRTASTETRKPTKRTPG